MLLGEVADLVRLLIDEILGIGQVVVDHLLILDVQERREEGEGGEKEG